jgi:outer membrane protein assembly factor BamB
LFPAVLDAATGNPFEPLASSGPAPAVDAWTVYDLSGSALTATNAVSGMRKWQFTGDGTLSSAPLVAGGAVFVGGTSGNLYALSSGTGAVIWSNNVGTPISTPDEQNESELTGNCHLGRPADGLRRSDAYRLQVRRGHLAPRV